ncbi:MAG: nucleoside triphosphate pyrophosphohydrolase [Defluviicoccus sp.]|nr:nucleoside triphosphate pyrophosphohydrolase [Defluviicoccus sp.]MDE0382650.1 nucleoside triphosphate pyrophosphohydrolase [Defluviicoccus sp.]
MDEIPPIEALLRLMTRLRDRESGCPWDAVQTFATIAPYTIEEAYEVADAIARDDLAALEEELGDLLLQVVFHAEMAREAGAFDFDSVARGITGKMYRRHPHVFGDGEDGSGGWEAIKARERRAKAERASALDGVALALPALLRARKLQERAARVGFDWPDMSATLAKVDEELGELKEAIEDGGDATALAEEVGDLLFACVNVARRLGIDPEQALRDCNDKFIRRFNAIEDGLAKAGKAPEDSTLEEMDGLWEAAKRREREAAGS